MIERTPLDPDQRAAADEGHRTRPHAHWLGSGVLLAGTVGGALLTRRWPAPWSMVPGTLSGIAAGYLLALTRPR